MTLSCQPVTWHLRCHRKTPPLPNLLILETHIQPDLGLERSSPIRLSVLPVLSETGSVNSPVLTDAFPVVLAAGFLSRHLSRTPSLASGSDLNEEKETMAKSQLSRKDLTAHLKARGGCRPGQTRLSGQDTTGTSRQPPTRLKGRERKRLQTKSPGQENQEHLQEQNWSLCRSTPVPAQDPGPTATPLRPARATACSKSPKRSPLRPAQRVRGCSTSPHPRTDGHPPPTTRPEQPEHKHAHAPRGDTSRASPTSSAVTSAHGPPARGASRKGWGRRIKRPARDSLERS